MRVLITGAGRAIGRATAIELTAQGHEVVATARHLEILDDLDVEQTLALDVTDDASVAEALAAAGELDAIVNNAALAGPGPLEGFPLDRLRGMLETNTVGPLRLVQAVLPAWRDRGSGVIVNISSVQGRVASPLEGAYAATKFGLEALSETLHYELRHFGIRTVIVQPGYIAPGMKDAPPSPGPEAYEDLWRQWSGTDAKVTGPAGRPGPELVARAVADALSDPNTPLRVEVGDDARLILSTRRDLDDATFEAVMRQTLGLTW